MTFGGQGRNRGGLLKARSRRREASNYTLSVFLQRIHLISSELATSSPCPYRKIFQVALLRDKRFKPPFL
jgi:hypothetical protein